MNSHVRVIFASDLEEESALGALVGISLFFMDPLMLRKISGGVVGSRAFIAEEVSRVYVVGHVILEIV